jgi:molybdopterin molybdotransferase
MEDISFRKAYELTISSIQPLSVEVVTIEDLAGRVTAEDLFSHVDSPSRDVSLKDGYAVITTDIERASRAEPIFLKLEGSLMAGSNSRFGVTAGCAVKIMSGGVIPQGAEAVVSNEFASDDGVTVRVVNHAAPGQNILKKGTDIVKGEKLLQKGTRLLPTHVGLIAAAGHSYAKVHRRPRVALIATGDEVLAPGMLFEEGKVFASNLVTLSAWCSFYGMESETAIVKDDESDIRDAIVHHVSGTDCLITSGGAWKGERDLVIKILDGLGWKKSYHRVKIGPGKAVGFGLLRSKPVFCLPGGPPSNQIAFLQLALPGLLILSGNRDYSLPSLNAVLGDPVRGQKDWTQFIFGTIARHGKKTVFHPLKMASRLQEMAKAEGIICIPEGKDYLAESELVEVQVPVAITI